MNLREIIIHRAMSMMPKSAPGVNIQSFNALANTIELETVYDLGTYPGGTWTQMNDINNDGVAIGAGDIKVGGESRPIGIPLFGPKSFVWFDLGQFINKQTDTGASCNRISDAGMIVGSAAIEQGYQHAFSWTPGAGAKKTDLGTWKQADFDTYDTCSAACGVNDREDLIVGLSHTHQLGTGPKGPLAGLQTPVVWTPTVVWKAGRPTTTWKIQRLDTGGLERPGKVIPGVTLNRWAAVAVNDVGQIIGQAYTDPDASGFGNGTPVIWNPIPGEKSWKVARLPLSLGYPNGETLDINNRGEAVGYINPGPESGRSCLPALWKPTQPSGRVYSLTALPVLNADGWYSGAYGINDLGDIVGSGVDESWHHVAVLWSSKDPSFVRALGFPGIFSWAWGVNDLGLVVGTYGDDYPPGQAIAVKFK